MSDCIVLSGLKIRQPIGDLYVAKIKAKDLLKISYSDIRAIADETYRNTYLGIQRKLDPKREKEIAEYVQTFDATFPTSIVVYIDENNVEIKENNNDTLQITIINMSDKTAKIIDGQHRLAGLQVAIDFLEQNNSDLFNTGDQKLQAIKDFELSLTILIGMDIAEQANIFSKVNLTQTKVNKSLVYDLEEYSKIRSPYKSAHNIAIALNYNEKSPFYKKIKRLGYIDFGRETLTQQTFVESLTKLFLSPDPEKDRDDMARYEKLSEIDYSDKFPFRKLFADNNDVTIAKILYNYFNAVKSKWPEAWESSKYLLSKNNGFRALMKYLRDIYTEASSNNTTVPTVEIFFKYFESFEIRSEEFTPQNFKLGESGMNEFYKYLSGTLSYQDLISNKRS